jgi:hypothetical protein
MHAAEGLICAGSCIRKFGQGAKPRIAGRMTDGIIPDDVRDFILGHIDSVAQLEALLLLRKGAERDWSAADVAGRLYIDTPAAAELLARLAAEGICGASNGLHRYDPATPELARLIDRLAETYARYLIPVTNLIHAKPSRVQQFADAFRFRKEK